MRDIFLVCALAVGLGFTVRNPFVGVLIWEWFALMAPHEEAYGFAKTIPLNLIIAVLTMGSFLASKETKRLPSHPLFILLAIFLAWTTFNSFFAFDPSWSWTYWDRTWRIFVLGFMVAALTTNKARMDAVVWVAAISLFYYGVKGGVFTIQTGGTYKVFGPPSTIIQDNNQLALALLMAIPLVEYLRSSVTSKILSWILAASMALTAVAILGSYSRGAYVAMAALAVFALLHTRRRIAYLAGLALVMVPALYFMPQTFYDRVNSMNSVDAVSADASFHGRWIAWQVATRYATDHFPFGAGFYGPQLSGIFNAYFPLEPNHAAHSIYFQVLGEQGFIGLVLYLCVVFVSFTLCWRIVRRTKHLQDKWIHKLAQMIQSSLLVFYVGGAALSMAYYDLFLILVCLLPQLSLIASQELAFASGVRAWRAVPAEPLAAT